MFSGLREIMKAAEELYHSKRKKDETLEAAITITQQNIDLFKKREEARAKALESQKNTGESLPPALLKSCKHDLAETQTSCLI